MVVCMAQVHSNTITKIGCSDTSGLLMIQLGILNRVKLQLHGAIYRPDSFALMLRYCLNLKAIRYESTTLNRIVADKSHRVIVA